MHPLTARRKRIVLLCASGTSALIMLDTNIVAVSLPSIARDVHAGFTGVQWVVSAYLLTFAALLLPSGSLADLRGRRRIVLAGLAVFLVSSAACGLATSAPMLEAARAVQGIGGSLLLTSALAIIAATFDTSERPKAYAFWGTALGVAITSGPIAGGLITGLFGWRWAFLINVPLCILFFAAIRAFVPESRNPQARRFDVLGVVTLSAGMFALIWALIDGNALGWTARPIVLRLAVAVAGLAAFVFVERTRREPMADLSLFRRRGVIGATFGTFGYGASAQVMIFFLPLYLQGAFGLSPAIAGFAMLPFALPLVLAPRIAAALLRAASHRTALVAGIAITAAGDALLAALAHANSYPAIACAMLVAGAGTGVLNPQSAQTMQAQIPADRAGMASGIGATLRFISLLLGVAVLGAVVARYRPEFALGVDHNAASAFAAAATVAAGIALLAMLGTATFMTPPAPATVPESAPRRAC